MELYMVPGFQVHLPLVDLHFAQIFGKLNDKSQHYQLRSLILFDTQNADAWSGQGQQHREHVGPLRRLHDVVAVWLSLVGERQHL
jgi:hypothetical protein